MIAAMFALLGFACGVAQDVASLRAVPRIKPLLLTAEIGAFVVSGFVFLTRSPKVDVHIALRIAALPVTIGGFAGMVYSIAIEIPFRRAWLERGHTETLVTSGTYSIARHPGVLWAAAWLPSVAIASASRDLFRWWPLILIADIVHVWFQDRFVLPSVFGAAYRDYQSRVPFLIPRLRRSPTGLPNSGRVDTGDPG